MARLSIPTLIACAALGGLHLASTDASAAGRGGGVAVAPPVASQTLAPGPGAFAPKRPSVTTTTTTIVPAGPAGQTHQGASPAVSSCGVVCVTHGNGNGAGDWAGFASGKDGLGAGNNLNNSIGDALGTASQGASALSGIAPADAASVRR